MKVNTTAVPYWLLGVSLLVIFCLTIYLVSIEKSDTDKFLKQVEQICIEKGFATNVNGQFIILTNK